jgi:hypothetical protein
MANLASFIITITSLAMAVKAGPPTTVTSGTKESPLLRRQSDIPSLMSFTNYGQRLTVPEIGYPW